jgi:hypothetical protein
VGVEAGARSGSEASVAIASMRGFKKPGDTLFSCAGLTRAFAARIKSGHDVERKMPRARQTPI